MSHIKCLLDKSGLSANDLVELLTVQTEEDIEFIRQKAMDILNKNGLQKVYLRGLIEFSNICECNCFYCGIRKGNSKVERYTLSEDEVLKACQQSVQWGYASVVLQSGERKDPEFITMIEKLIFKIKETTKTSVLPDGLGITLSLGEQNKNTYQRWFEAGAHRYLLRIEASDPFLFQSIHPSSQIYVQRKECLKILKEIGYQTGSGVMIGLPGQTPEMLANDILFFKSMDLDMIGMGPYIPHKDTPFGKLEADIDLRRNLSLSFLMIALTRIVLKDVNIAASTALQAIDPFGREKGLEFGANVLMPQMTPTDYRKQYFLYEGKPCSDEDSSQCYHCQKRRVEAIGRPIGWNEWGDSLHFKRVQ